jgi:hypothetical protein
MHPAIKIALCVPFYLAVWLISITANADPIIHGSPSANLSFGKGQFGPNAFHCPTCIPESDLSFSYSVITPSFATVSTTGGGVASVFAPSLHYGIGGIGINASGDLTTIGPGSATAHFGETILANITNTTGSDGQVWIAMGYNVGTGVSADPSLGESMSYSWNLGVLPADNNPYYFSREYEIQSRTCNGNNTVSYHCHNFYDLNSRGFTLNIASGQTLSYELIMDVNWSVAEVPEPSSLMLLASMVALGFYPLRSAAKLSR